jgi:hypothetical protein
MCFSENQSYINTLLLLAGGYFTYPNIRLTMPLIFLSSKDLLQGLLYRNLENKKVNNILTSLSWLHICFQPLMVNVFLSNFSRRTDNFWSIIFLVCTIYAVGCFYTLQEFNDKKEENCVTNDKKDDFCATSTMSYQGEYHIGYRFRRNKDKLYVPILYILLMFVPALFTEARLVCLLWLMFASSFTIFFPNIGSGEKAAMWCYSSIAFILPLSILVALSK